MLFTTLAVAALASLAQAVNVQVVSVGKNPVNNKTDTKFWPEKITAEPGTMVQFQFWAGNHTVTQSTFDNPCIPISNINSSIRGIYSGYQPVGASEAMGMIPTFTVMINDTKPLWLFCSKGKHCQAGMALVINENTKANSSRSLENYKAGASSATGSEIIPASGGNNGGNNGAKPSGSTTLIATTQPASPTTIRTVAPTGGAATTTGGTPTTSGTRIPSPTAVPVTAAAPSFSIPSALLLALGATFFLF